MVSKNFAKGQYVVYATNGLCCVEDIKYISFISGKEEKLHYILKPVKGSSSVIYVPADNDNLMAKMRPAMTKEDIDSLLLSVKDKQLIWDEDRKARVDNFHDILINGVSENLLLMISCIYIKKQELMALGKTLPASYSKMLENAEKLVEEEFSYALDIAPSDVGKYIRDFFE